MDFSVATPITDAQKAAIRFHLGYPLYRSDDDTEAPYYRSAELEMLEYALNHLRVEEQALVVMQLGAIQTAYTNWISASANLATTSVAIIERNPNEMPQRRDFYIQACRDLASMIDVPYMTSTGTTTNIIV